MEPSLGTGEYAMQKPAKQILRARRAAMIRMGDEVFSDPAWHVLLALYAGREAAKPFSAGAVASDAGLARATAWRTLTALNQHKLVSLSRDMIDKRVVRVRLTEKGRSAIEGSLMDAQFLPRVPGRNRSRRRVPNTSQD